MSGEITNFAKFVKAGKALFTIQNNDTAGRFTFKVKRFDKAEDKEIWFVSVLNGPDNYSNYRYVGTIFGSDFRHTKKSISKDSPAYKAFAWFNKRMNKNSLPENVKVYHEGRCGRCGRKLTVPESITAGYGPECINLV
jgi:hypothetical protein